MKYGENDNTFQALGGIEGLTRLCNKFYEIMDTIPEAKVIRKMHPKDLSISTDKLIHFLSGWTGGPRTYRDKYGPIQIPIAHQHLNISVNEKYAWMLCMHNALIELNYPEDLRNYLLEQLAFPAEKIRQVSQARIEFENSKKNKQNFEN